MSEPSEIDRVWDIIEQHSIGMLTTQFAGGLRSRPLDARPDRDAGAIHFVTDAHNHKDGEIAAQPDVCFVVVVPGDNIYLSVTGRASVSRDTAVARKIWKKTDDLWWKGGPVDVNARVLRVDPVTAELWDGPSNSLVAVYEFAKAKITGEKPFLGENLKKTVPMG